MGTICSSMLQLRRDADAPNGNGVGSGEDTDLEGSITERGEIDPGNCPTHNTNQLENRKNRGHGGEAQAQKGGSDAPKRGKKRVATTETNARKRSKNWKPDETLKLIESRLQPSLERGKSEWEAISIQIPGRTGKQCQQRWDTVVKPYKKIKRHCDDHGKDFSQLTEEEFRILNVNCGYWRDDNWYNMIDEYHLRVASGHVARDLNGASTSASPILGENDALLAGVVTATIPVEQGEPSPAAVTGGGAGLHTMEPHAPTSTTASDAEDPGSVWRKVLLILESTE